MEPWLQLLLQVPLVGVFIWFSLEQQKIYTQNQTKRDEEWRLFLIEQRKANNDAVVQVAKELKENSTILAEVQATMVLHVQQVQLAIPGMQEVVKKLEDTQQRKGRGGGA